MSAYKAAIRAYKAYLPYYMLEDGDNMKRAESDFMDAAAHLTAKEQSSLIDYFESLDESVRPNAVYFLLFDGGVEAHLHL